jgi:hypothetical protein
MTKNKTPKIIILDHNTYIEIINFTEFEVREKGESQTRVEIYGILKKEYEEPKDPYLQTR